MNLRLQASEILGFPIGQTMDEVVLLKKYAKRVKATDIIIEVGTRNGGSALVLAMAGDTQVVTIDVLEDPRNPGYGYGEIPLLEDHWTFYPGGERIEQVTCVSWEYEHDGRSVGLVFLDGGHEYKEIRSDWGRFFPLLVDCGFLLVHDYGVFTGVTKFINELNQKPIEQVGSIVVFQKGKL